MDQHEIETVARMTGVSMESLQKVLSLLAAPRLGSPVGWRRIRARQVYEAGGGLDAVIEKATQVQVTQDLAQAYMDAPGGGGLRAAFTAAGFEIIE